MIVSDGVYYRIPQFWLVLGLAFLLLGLVAGTEYRWFHAHLLLGALCILRSWQIYHQRRKISRRKRMNVLTQTQRLDRNEVDVASSANSAESP
jgi:hypothetical protein